MGQRPIPSNEKKAGGDRRREERRRWGGRGADGRREEAETERRSRPRPHNGRSDLPATNRTYRENLLKNQEERGKHDMNTAQTVYARWISKASLEQEVRR